VFAEPLPSAEQASREAPGCRPRARISAVSAARPEVHAYQPGYALALSVEGLPAGARDVVRWFAVASPR
jgi:hypothetical protein